VVKAAVPSGAPPIRSSHGDWDLRCSPGSPGEQCALMQAVTATGVRGLGLTVLFLKMVDAPQQIMRVLVPLGVVLPAGLGLEIDQAKVGRAGFVRCLPDGCVAEIVLDDNLRKALVAGKTATFIIYQDERQGFAIPISLAGLAAGLAALP
jgi:invasion protein IalB